MEMKQQKEKGVLVASHNPDLKRIDCTEPHISVRTVALSQKGRPPECRLSLLHHMSKKTDSALFVSEKVSVVAMSASPDVCLFAYLPMHHDA